MNSSDQVRQLYRLLRCSDGQPEVMDAIWRLIREDSQARRTYVRLMQMESHLPWVLGAPHNHATSVEQQYLRQRRSLRRLQGWVASTVLMAAILIYGVAQLHRSAKQTIPYVNPTFVARLVIDGEVTINHQPCTKSRIFLRQGEKVVLQAGTILLYSDRGSVLALTAPLIAEMPHSRSLTLHRGEVVAEITPEDRGFEILTPGGRFVDLGTKFCAAVDADRHSELHVLQGLVSAHSIARTSSGDPVMLAAGEAVALSETGQTTAIEFLRGNRFANGLNRFRGITQLDGDLVLLSTPPNSVEPGKLVSKSQIFVFEEQLNLELKSPVSVAPPTPTIYTSPGQFTPVELPVGTRCTSYFLHADGSLRDAPLTGTIRFDRPILGLIFSTGELQKSDAVLANSGVAYPTDEAVLVRGDSRGSIVPYGGRKERFDQIVVHEDRRGITVKLNAPEDNTDQVRVLVSAASP
ncbi:FecR domain-containing protein [Planctomicrobium sp. SH661]|uniref:FecR domain-containing protein n=1 Tax=Planctomicrobium sp. SH661 TaxID=3448124 RepID=UPI003F5BA5DA